MLTSAWADYLRERTIVAELKLPEGIVRLTHALVADAALRSWFVALDSVSPPLRRSALQQMATQMRAAREDQQLIDAVAAMTHPDVYAAVRQTVRERCRV